MYHSRHCIGYISRGWRNFYRQSLIGACGSISTTSSSSLISKFDVAYHYPSIKLQLQSTRLQCCGILSSKVSLSPNQVSNNNISARALSPTSRCFSSSSLSTVSNNTKIYHYGCTNIKDRIQLSTLKPRQSAEIEDELYSSQK